MPKITIAIPTHNMDNKDFFLKRLLDSIKEQTFTDYEIVITEDGKMAENTNSAIKKANGDLIKIMYMDDYFAHKDALKRIVEAFKGNWLASGCGHQDNPILQWDRPHIPSYEGIEQGINTIGSPSVVTIRNGLDIYFDENMTWLLDVDFYKRLNAKYGPPDILEDINVVMGIGPHQATNQLSDQLKINEEIYLKQKYEKN